MRHFMITLAVLLAATLAASSPLERHSGSEGIKIRDQRYDHYSYDKEQPSRLKILAVNPASTKTGGKPYPSLRKGEYICGNKVCKLQPGDKPPCDICQHPI